MACRKFNDCSSCEHGMSENDGCYRFTGLSPFCEDFFAYIVERVTESVLTTKKFVRLLEESDVDV